MKMSLIVFGALGLTFLLRRRSAALRHWVLAAGVVCAAALPFLTAVVPTWSLPFATPAAFVPYDDGYEVSGTAPTIPRGQAGTSPAVTLPSPKASPRGFDLVGTLQT